MARTATGKRTSFGTSMGVSSIIAILVILVLVVFSALSITTAKADLTLSQKSADSIKAYYEADAAAEDKMAEVAIAIKTDPDWQAHLAQEGYDISSGLNGTVIGYTLAVDENRNLNVQLLADEDGNVSQKLWQVAPSKEWTPDENINLFIPQ